MSTKTVEFENNPMSIWRDLCTNTEYGMGITLTEGQEAYIATWEKYLEEKVIE